MNATVIRRINAAITSASSFVKVIETKIRSVIRLQGNAMVMTTVETVVMNKAVIVLAATDSRASRLVNASIQREFAIPFGIAKTVQTKRTVRVLSENTLAVEENA